MIPKPSETKPFVCLSSQTHAQRLVLPTEAAPTDGSEVTGPVLYTPVLHHKVNLTHTRLPSTPKYIPRNAVQKGNPLLNPIQSLPMLARNGHQEARENLPGLSARLLTDNCSRELHPCCFQGSGNKTPKFPFDFVPHNPSSVRFMLFLQGSSGPLSFMNNGLPSIIKELQWQQQRSFCALCKQAEDGLAWDLPPPVLGWLQECWGH